MKRFFIIMFLIIIFLKSCDLSTTWIGVCEMDGIEMNPYFTDLSYRFGFIGASLTAILIDGIIILTWYLSHRFTKNKTLFFITSFIVSTFIIISFSAVSHNIMEILTPIQNPTISNQQSDISPLVSGASGEEINGSMDKFNRNHFCRLK